MSFQELENVVDDVIARYTNPKKLYRPFNIIISEVMKIVRYRIDGKIVSDVIINKLEKFNE